MFRWLTGRLQNKLVFAFILVLLIPTLALVGYNLTIARANSIETAETAETEELQNVRFQALAIENYLVDVTQQLLFLRDSNEISTYAEIVDKGDETALTENLDEIGKLFSAFSQNFGRYDQVRLLDVNGVEIVRVNLVNGQAILVAQDELQDQSNRPYYSETIGLANGDIYISALNLNRERGVIEVPYKPVIRYATPVYDSSNTVQGMVILNVLGQPFLDLVEADEEGDRVYLVDQDGTYFVSPDESQIFGLDFESGINFFSENENDAPRILESTGREGSFDNSEDNKDKFTAFVKVSPPGQDEIRWTVVHQIPLDEVLASVNETQNAILGIGAVAAVFSILFGLIVTRDIVRPVNRLGRAATSISQGKLDTEVPVLSRTDEIGQLSNAFAIMSRELQAIYGTLEQRIEEATRNLQTVFDVNSQIATLLDVNRLLQDVVDLTKERFGLYHAHIYLLDDETLILASGAGHVGRKMVSEQRQIALSNPQSVVARAARNRQPAVVNDVQKEGFLPHPLLPETKSELAIALVARGAVLGVLDVQGAQKEYFTSELVRIMELLAAQIATAISNARLYEIAERTSRHEQAVSRISEKMQSAASVDEILQVSVRELGKALRVPYTAIQLEIKSSNGDSDSSHKKES